MWIERIINIKSTCKYEPKMISELCNNKCLNSTLKYTSYYDGTESSEFKYFDTNFLSITGIRINSCSKSDIKLQVLQ